MTVDLTAARRVYDHLPVHLGAAVYHTSIYQGAAEFPVYMVDCPPLFDRKEPIRARADRLNRDPDLAVELVTATFS